MQVAILTANALERDAIGNQVVEKLSFFLDRGADVRVYAQSTDRVIPAVRPFCHSFDPEKPTGDEWTFLSTCDLVVAEYGQYYPYLQLLPLLAQAKPRIVFQYYGVTPPEHWDSHNRETLELAAAYRGLAWCADLIITPSRFARQELMHATDLPRSRIRTLSLPVDTEHFTPGPVAHGFRQQHNLHEATVMLFVGRIAPNKGLPVLIRALSDLRDKVANIHAVVIGDDTDVYDNEKCRCQTLAAAVGVTDRLHFLGQVSDESLRDAYRSADVLVIPSVHEGFCIPVIEAMACGLPIVAARTSALKETIGDSGLSFVADEPADLARQVMRVVSGIANASKCSSPVRVAVVAARYGDDFVGGAESSLRLIAETLHAAGHSVEVFTTGPRTEVMNGIRVHRYSTDEILSAVRARQADFDAVITGPYLHEISASIAAEFGPRTILVPCFHDEPQARSGNWHQTYADIGGIWYHSPEEQKLAEAELGVHSPRSSVIGTYVDVNRNRDTHPRMPNLVRKTPYLAYAGRYIEEKGMRRLLEFARRYSETLDGRFIFAFMGQGNIPIPDEPWAQDLGFVSESVKHEVLANAAALLTLSTNESLSLVMLEAWAHGTPVAGAAQCEVFQGHLQRGNGGLAIESYDDFSATLDDLWNHPERWKAMGAKAQRYVQEWFGCKTKYSTRLVDALEAIHQPIADQMRERGLARAAQTSRRVWRENFAQCIEEALDSSARENRERIDIEPRYTSRAVSASLETLLVPIRVVNHGNLPALPHGPAAVRVHGHMRDSNGNSNDLGDMALPTILLTGRKVNLAFPVRIPTEPGAYQIQFDAARAGTTPDKLMSFREDSMLTLVVRADLIPAAENGCSAEFLSELRTLLATAQKLQSLPDDYTDVTQGRFAKWKAWIKKKLLGNFKQAYVDVLSRQQSAFNQKILASLQEIAECCATLDSAVSTTPKLTSQTDELTKLRAELKEAREDIRTLAQQLDATGTTRTR